MYYIPVQLTIRSRVVKPKFPLDIYETHYIAVPSVRMKSLSVCVCFVSHVTCSCSFAVIHSEEQRLSNFLCMVPLMK
jgi:hypothetical protein